MELRSPEAFWLLKNGILQSYPKLQEDTECDIVVLGAGITGALISHSLREAGYNVIVIDKHLWCACTNGSFVLFAYYLYGEV